jgi:uncharacterized membrane protein
MTCGIRRHEIMNNDRTCFIVLGILTIVGALLAFTIGGVLVHEGESWLIFALFALIGVILCSMGYICCISKPIEEEEEEDIRESKPVVRI